MIRIEPSTATVVVGESRGPGSRWGDSGPAHVDRRVVIRWGGDGPVSGARRPGARLDPGNPAGVRRAPVGRCPRADRGVLRRRASARRGANSIDRMSADTRAVVFGDDAGSYELARPDYPPEALAHVAGLVETETAVEVGAGTGKATAGLRPPRARARSVSSRRPEMAAILAAKDLPGVEVVSRPSRSGPARMRRSTSSTPPSRGTGSIAPSVTTKRCRCCGLKAPSP